LTDRGGPDTIAESTRKGAEAVSMSDSRPVGVFDSGMGGIGTLASLVRELPGERFIYYGDTLHAPYGTRTTEEVLRLTEDVVRQLEGDGIKALVIACNTATGAAAAALRAEKAYPVIGMEPALKPAEEHWRGGVILVMATPLTLRQEKFFSRRRAFFAFKRHSVRGHIYAPLPGFFPVASAEITPSGLFTILMSSFLGFFSEHPRQTRIGILVLPAI
jgi:glutamate racemase